MTSGKNAKPRLSGYRCGSAWTLRLVGLLCFLLMALGLRQDAVAYNTESHNWINERAVKFLINKGSEVAKTFPLEDYLTDLNWGSYYADHTEILCEWSVFGDSWTYSCDQLHHYGKTEVIETKYGFDIGHPGHLTAPVYAQALFAQTVNFWPGGPSPSLASLTRYDAGYFQVPGSYKSLGDSWGGGLPLCTKWVSKALGAGFGLFYIPDYCPKWPVWATNDTPQTPLKQRYRKAVEGVSTALRYLGWALHMVQDMTVPHHARNSALPSHQKYEDLVDSMVADKKPDGSPKTPTLAHLPAPVSGPYPYKLCTFGGDCKKLHPVMKEYFSNRDFWSVKQFAEEAGRISRDAEVSPGYELKYEIQIERNVDLAIKLVAVLLEKYFAPLILKADQFEDNDNYYDAKKLKNNSAYSNLSIDKLDDEDWYLIEVPEDFSDAMIEVRFDESLGDIGMVLYGLPAEGSRRAEAPGQGPNGGYLSAEYLPA